MKRFNQLTDADKATTLHQWFPKEAKEFLSYLEGTAKGIVNDSNNVKPKTLKAMFTADDLKEVASQLAGRINTFYQHFTANAIFFAEQLFTEPNQTRFTIDCLQQFARICPNNKLRECVTLFFI